MKKSWILAASLLMSGSVFAEALPIFSDYPAGPPRKEAFFNYFTPIIDQENTTILANRNRLKKALADNLISEEEKIFILSLADKYKIKNFDISSSDDKKTLLRRVDVIPRSMALAQSANESAWGTSRFATKGNNYFGQWCFSKGCGLIPLKRNAGASHEVAAFKSPKQSVQRYMHNLNTHNAYKKLRLLRAAQRTKGEKVRGLELVKGLNKYSERGKEYVKELSSMIRYNKLTD